MGDLSGDHLAGDLAGRRRETVGRRRERNRSVAGVGEGRGVGCVRVGEAGAGALARAGGAGGGACGERPALGGAEGDGGRADLVPGKAERSGFSARFPTRVSAETKLELLGLIDSAVPGRVGAHARVRGPRPQDVRAHRWRARLRGTGSLEDGRPVGDAVHRLLACEEQAILDLIEQWGWVDRRIASSRTAAPTPAWCSCPLRRCCGWR